MKEELPKKKFYAAINKAFELGLIEKSESADQAGESYSAIEKIVRSYLDAKE